MRKGRRGNFSRCESHSILITAEFLHTTDGVPEEDVIKQCKGFFSISIKKIDSFFGILISFSNNFCSCLNLKSTCFVYTFDYV